MLETVGSTISRLWGTKQSRRAIICVVLMIGSVATPVAVSPVNDADAAPSPDIYIDDDETDPSVNQDLNAGQTYTFDFVIGYEVPEGESAEVQLNFPNLGGDTVTRQVTGTGEVTISVTKTVPKELIGDSLRINAIVNGENINLDVDKEEYSVVAPGDPPEIDSTDPSAENTVVVEKGETRSFSVSASDPDNDDLTYTWYIKKATGDYEQVASGSSSYSHTFDEPLDDGETAYYLKVEVEDNYHVVSTEWLIDVGPENLDRSPSISRVSPSSQDIPISSGDTKQFEVDVSDPDTDYDRLVWSVDGSQVDTRTGLPEESSFTDSFEYTFETGESHTISAKIIDSNGNSASLNWGTKQPDLAVTSVELDPSAPEPGETTQIRMTIENTGGAAADPVDHEIRIDGGNTIVPPAVRLEPGESITRTRDYEFSEGSHTVTGYVDPDDKIAELNEANNQRSISTDAQTPNGPLTVTAVNENGATVPDAKITLYEDVEDGWNSIEAKRAGADGTVSWSGLETGTYNLEVYSPSGNYWGTKTDIKVTTDGSSVTIPWTAPRATTIDLIDESGDGVYTNGEPVTISPTVQNDGAERPVRVKIQIDTDDDDTPEITKTRGGLDSTVVPSGETQSYGYDFEPSSTGSKQVRVITMTYLNEDWNQTDETVWKPFEVTEGIGIEASRTETVTGSPVSLRAVILDGSPSGTLPYVWRITDTPENSGRNPASISYPNDQDARFHPKEVGKYTVELQATNQRGEKFTESIVINVTEHNPLIDRYAPIIELHKEEKFRPTRYEAFVRNSELVVSEGETQSREVRIQDPSLYDLGSAPSDAHLVLQGNPDLYYTYDQAYKPTVHASIHKNVRIDEKSTLVDNNEETDLDDELTQGQYTAITYWLFYIYDPKNGGPSSVVAHESDTETVTVLIKDGEPKYFAASQHYGGEIREWNKTNKKSSHPLIYPAKGAHANYLRNTSNYSDAPFPYQGQFIAPSGLSTDKAANYLERTGGGTVLSPRNSETGDKQYDIVPLTGNEDWQSYEGYLSDNDGYLDLAGTAGKVPKKKTRWQSPEEWIASIPSDESQIDGEIVSLSVKNNRIISTEVRNLGVKPHEFWITTSAKPAEASWGSKRVYSESKPLKIGTRNEEGLFDTPFDTRSTSVSAVPPSASGDWDVRVNLSAYPPDVAEPEDRFETRTVTLTGLESIDSLTARVSASDPAPAAGETFTLDASGSTDPSGDDSQLRYDWSVRNKPDGANTELPSGSDGEITLSEPGTYQFAVTVTNEQGLTDTATETVQVESTEPTDKWTGVTEVEANSTQTGTITPQSDEDTVSIPVQQGDVLNHTLEKPEGADIRLSVTYPNAPEDESSAKSKSTLNASQTITQNGVVEVTVSSNGDATGDWTLTNSRQHEVDEYIATQPKEVTSETTVTGRINTIDDQDVVEIPVEAGQQLNLSLSRINDNGMYVTYPGGEVIQKQPGPDYGDPRPPLYANATIQEAGTVEVKIYSATKAFRDSQDTGPWTLDIRSPTPEPTTGTLMGTVTDDTGAPATGAQVSINDGEGTTTTVSEDGSYRFTEVYGGEYTVEVSGENYATKTVSVEVTPGQTTTQDIEVTQNQPDPDPVCADCNAPKDPDGDGKYEDVNGNDVQGFGDVVTLFENFGSESVTQNSELYDYNNNGVVGFGDVIYLFESI